MTEESSELFLEEESDERSGGSLKYVVYRSPREVYERVLGKYEDGAKINFREYRRKEDYITTETQALTAEEVRRRYGAGYYIIEHLDGRTPKDLSFVNIPPRGETVLSADRGPRYYGQRPVQRPPYYPQRRNRARAPRRGESRADGLLRELIAEQKEQHRAEVARIEEHNREAREREQRHQEELRRLERERDEEKFKRLDEKIEAANSREDKEPPDWKTLLLQIAVEKVKGGDDETADGLLKMVKEEEGGGGFWSLANNLVDKVIDNPQGTMQTVGALAQMLGLVRQSAPAQPTAQAQPTQQGATAPPPLSDLQLLDGVSKALGSAIIADQDPAPLAQAIRDILEERPHLRPPLETMLRQGDEELLSTLATSARVSFDALGRAPMKWAREFRKALKCYGIGADVPPVEPTNNGHMPKPEAAAVQ